MPRSGGRRRTGLGWKDHRRRGIGIVNIPTAERDVVSDGVTAVYNLLSASVIVGSSTKYIVSSCVDEVYDMLTVQLP